MNQSKTFGSAKPAPAATDAAGTSAKSTGAQGPATTGSKTAPTLPGATPAKTKSSSGQPQTGKVVHDERGTAVWDWLKQTGRNAIESTTRMLRKLEAPELKVEQAHEEELRIQPDRGTDAGGGYDPYNQPIKSRRTPTK
jgi:hypothetical protein